MQGRPRLSQMQALCTNLHPDDGVDPRDFFREKGTRKPNHRKAHQLCAQVAETLCLILAGDGFDEVLSDLRVISVTPAPDTSQLLVIVGPATTNRLPDGSEVAAHLHAAAGRLRADVTAAITRRRAPKLIFHYLPAVSGGQECQ